jgi:hypothetical protein
MTQSNGIISSCGQFCLARSRALSRTHVLTYMSRISTQRIQSFFVGVHTESEIFVGVRKFAFCPMRSCLTISPCDRPSSSRWMVMNVICVFVLAPSFMVAWRVRQMFGNVSAHSVPSPNNFARNLRFKVTVSLGDHERIKAETPKDRNPFHVHVSFCVFPHLTIVFWFKKVISNANEVWWWWRGWGSSSEWRLTECRTLSTEGLQSGACACLLSIPLPSWEMKSRWKWMLKGQEHGRKVGTTGRRKASMVYRSDGLWLRSAAREHTNFCSRCQGNPKTGFAFVYIVSHPLLAWIHAQAQQMCVDDWKADRKRRDRAERRQRTNLWQRWPRGESGLFYLHNRSLLTLVRINRHGQWRALRYKWTCIKTLWNIDLMFVGNSLSVSSAVWQM